MTLQQQLGKEFKSEREGMGLLRKQAAIMINVSYSAYFMREAHGFSSLGTFYHYCAGLDLDGNRLIKRALINLELNQNQ